MPVDTTIVDLLSRIFANQAAAQTLLVRAHYPVNLIPNFTIPVEFWLNVCQNIDNGVMTGGIDAVMRVAADMFPANDGLARWRQPDSAPEQRRATGVTLFVSRYSDVLGLLNTARRLATELRVPGNVELVIAGANFITLNLPQANADQGAQLREGLSAQLNIDPRRIVLATPDFRDYMLDRLLVEGPDQQQFELSPVPASTRLKDIGRATMDNYADPAAPRDKSRVAEHVVIDHVRPEGPRRLSPERTLHEAGVKSGDTLRVAPERRAGAMNPNETEAARARVMGEILAYSHGHPDFKVAANSDHAPTEYTFTFPARSFAPPATPGSAPVPTDRHEVFLWLPPEFPMLAPIAFWQSLIFHPNVHPENGKVCLGILEKHYTPGLNFGELCQILVDIAGYHNYAVDGVYNVEAGRWALSRVGQEAIVARGGTSLNRLNGHHDDDEEPRPLSLRPLRP